MLNRIRPLMMATMVAMVATVCGCNGGSSGQSSTTSFAGINQTYTLASGSRKLQLNGLKGTYAAVTFSGLNTIPVSLTRDTMVIGGQSIPYLASQNLIQGGGYVGYADTMVIDDPAAVAGNFNTMVGANFPGQLTITSGHTYTWCQRSSFNSAGGCADGSVPLAGAIEALPLKGFKFAGVSGRYAAYHDGSAGALFPIDNHGLNLRALSQTASIPKGTFSQRLIGTTAHHHNATVTFSDNHRLKIKGIPNFSDTFTYTYANGVISFPSSACRNGTCSGIYNDKLGLVYLAQIGDILFFKP